MATHPDLQDKFFTEVGMELMPTDGRIMLYILSEFANAGVPALGIHDSVVCRESDEDFA